MPDPIEGKRLQRIEEGLDAEHAPPDPELAELTTDELLDRAVRMLPDLKDPKTGTVQAVNDPDRDAADRACMIELMRARLIKKLTATGAEFRAAADRINSMSYEELDAAEWIAYCTARDAEAKAKRDAANAPPIEGYEPRPVVLPDPAPARPPEAPLTPRQIRENAEAAKMARAVRTAKAAAEGQARRDHENYSKDQTSPFFKNWRKLI